MSSDITPPNKRLLAKDLLFLTGRSASSFASEIGVFRGSITQWLKHGGTSVGVEKQDELLFRLGVTGGSLDPNRVHRWTINQNLEPLREILDWVGEEFENIVLIPENVRVKDWFPTSNLFLLYSSPKSIRILLRQKISPLVPPGPSSWVDPANLPHVKWFDYQKGSGIIDKLTPNPLLRIPRNLFDKFWIDSDISSEEFDQVLALIKSLNGSRNFGEEISTKQRRSLTFKELKEIRARSEDGSVDSGVLREDIRTLLDHIESLEGK